MSGRVLIGVKRVIDYAVKVGSVCCFDAVFCRIHSYLPGLCVVSSLALYHVTWPRSICRYLTDKFAPCPENHVATLQYIKYRMIIISQRSRIHTKT